MQITVYQIDISPVRTAENGKTQLLASFFMPYYVYNIENEETSISYKRRTEDDLKRLEQHNKEENKYTSHGKWKLVYVEEHESRIDAIILLRKLKHANKDHLRRLIDQLKNTLNNNNKTEDRLYNNI